jgi:hypothetical protein
MRPADEGNAGRGSGVRLSTLVFVLALLVAGALAVAAYLLLGWIEDDVSASARPDVQLGSGTYAGRDWIYGYDVDTDGPCFKLSIDGSSGGCGFYRPPVDVMEIWTTSGNPEGFHTAQALVTDEVGSVRCLAGREPVGMTRLFEMPDGSRRPVLCLVTREELEGREWLAVAYDRQGDPLATEVAFDPR